MSSLSLWEVGRNPWKDGDLVVADGQWEEHPHHSAVVILEWDLAVCVCVCVCVCV